MLKVVSQLVTVLVFVNLVGCASARVVSVAPGEGGEIAIAPQGSLDARAKAEVIMRENCRQKSFKIVEEGEAVTGSITHNNARATMNAKTATAYSSGSAETKNTTEWRLKYKCEK